MLTPEEIVSLADQIGDDAAEAVLTILTRKHISVSAAPPNGTKAEPAAEGYFVEWAEYGWQAVFPTPEAENSALFSRMKDAIDFIREKAPNARSITVNLPNSTVKVSERPDMLDAADPEFVGVHFILYADRPDVGAQPEVEFKGDDVPEVFKDYAGREIVFWANGAVYPYVQWAPVIEKFPHMNTVRIERPAAAPYSKPRAENVKPLLVLPEAKANELIRRLTNLKEQRTARRKSLNESYDAYAKNMFASYGGKL